MPIYTYQCEQCGAQVDLRREVDARDTPVFCGDCQGAARRVFTPTANVFVHDHFRVLQSDFLPEKGDPAWADLQGGTGSQVRKPREKTFAEYFDEKYRGC